MSIFGSSALSDPNADTIVGIQIKHLPPGGACAGICTNGHNGATPVAPASSSRRKNARAGPSQVRIAPIIGCAAPRAGRDGDERCLQYS